MDKTPTGNSTVDASSKVNAGKVSERNIPNLQSFGNVRTTATAAKEGRLIVGVGNKKKSAKKAVMHKVIGKYK